MARDGFEIEELVYQTMEKERDRRKREGLLYFWNDLYRMAKILQEEVEDEHS